LRFAVIMSGGKGKRFWPLSRGYRAKQLVKLIEGKTLLELTVERLLPVFPEDHIMVVTQAMQVDATKEVLSRWPGIRILVEPVGKNTAPCIAFATTYAAHHHGDCVLTFLPADHFIRKVKTFQEILAATAEFAGKSDRVVTIGIKPDRPATGYGYIEVGQVVDRVDGKDFFNVERFTEKPTLDVAREYLASGRYLWNAGIFCFRASVMLDELKQYLPGISATFESFRQFYGTETERERLLACYQEVDEISIDYGVMEKTRRACVIPADIGWDDVGSWESFSKYLDSDEQGNRVSGRHIGLETRNCIVYSPRQVVATLGIKDLTIVVTDDAILIADRSRGEEVRRIVDLVESKGIRDLL